MKSIVIAIIAISLSGCAANRTPVVSDIVSAADFWCQLATQQSVEKAAATIMAQVPNGTDKATAQKYIDLALQANQIAAPLACPFLKAYEAQQPAS